MSDYTIIEKPRLDRQGKGNAIETHSKRVKLAMRIAINETDNESASKWIDRVYLDSRRLFRDVMDALETLGKG